MNRVNRKFGMNPIDSFPEPALPLRTVLPKFSEATRARLAGWAEAQGRATPENRKWLADRALAYGEKFVCTAARDSGEFDAHCGLLLATAALDLLKWRTTSRDDRDAAEHLGLAMSVDR